MLIKTIPKIYAYSMFALKKGLIYNATVTRFTTLNFVRPKINMGLLHRHY